MPLTWTTVVVPVTRTSYNYNGQPIPGSQVNFTHQYDKVTLDRPSTSSRVKPADLWMNGTSRTVTRTSVTSTAGPAVDDAKLTRYSAYLFCNLYSFSSVNAPSLTEPDRVAILNQIRNSLRGKASNLAMCLAEYPKTAKLFSDSARIIARGPRGIASSLAGAKRASRNVAKTHLAYQYGVKPLCDDMVNSFNALKDAAKVKPLYLQGKVRRIVRANLQTKNIGPQSSTLLGKADGECERMVIYDFAWRATMNPNGLRSTLAKHGFSNPLSLAYELIPYSFVLDWWINVGEVLASLDNLTMSDALYVRESKRSITVKRIYAGNQNTSGSATQVVTTDTRGVPGEISRINTVRYKPSVSLTHILNGLALLRTARRD